MQTKKETKLQRHGSHVQWNSFNFIYVEPKNLIIAGKDEKQDKLSTARIRIPVTFSCADHIFKLVTTAL